MNEKFLIDTDVLIDYFKGNPKAIDFMENLENELLISAITVAELFSGIREGKERQTIDAFISAFEFVPISLEIAKKGGLIRRDFGKSYGIGFGDSMIAATALETNSTLITLNLKHFKMLKNVLSPYKKEN